MALGWHYKRNHKQHYGLVNRISLICMYMEEMPESYCDFKVFVETKKIFLIPKRYHHKKSKDAIAMNQVFSGKYPPSNQLKPDNTYLFR